MVQVLGKSIIIGQLDPLSMSPQQGPEYLQRIEKDLGVSQNNPHRMPNWDPCNSLMKSYVSSVRRYPFLKQTKSVLLSVNNPGQGASLWWSQSYSSCLASLQSCYNARSPSTHQAHGAHTGLLFKEVNGNVVYPGQPLKSHNPKP